MVYCTDVLTRKKQLESLRRYMKVISGPIPMGTPWLKRYYEQVIIGPPWRLTITIMHEFAINVKSMLIKCMSRQYL